MKTQTKEAAMNATAWLRLRTACAARLLPLLVLLALPDAVQAQFSYTTSGGKVTITGYTGSGGAVVIPSTISGLPVTSIGSSRKRSARHCHGPGDPVPASFRKRRSRRRSISS